MSNKLSPLCCIKIAARGSQLSRVQVQEILQELQSYHPTYSFECSYVSTYGDRDHSISLRTLDKTDVFTREVDQEVLSGRSRLGIHSAKDLPDPLTKGLKCIALTKGVDPRDSLVLRDPLALKEGALIATSSLRREQLIQQLYPYVRCQDIRGTIEERLRKMDAAEFDGMVMAEAALIRLKLHHVYRLTLPGEPAPLQGRLAVIARQEDQDMAELFSWAAPQEEMFRTSN
ncbi:MAG: hydroxymethylbilane synthase [Verrucomicrobia bacterium]|nr:hydroxymethylbilane synthase [Verrucomicrobiota bacterium]MBS0645772.1 hydroxymethylbilane synthase [Verrucomicrobiota bacterium]